MAGSSWSGLRRRVQSVVGAAALAAVLLSGSVVQAVPVAMADSVGEIVVEPVAGKTIANVVDKFKQYGTSVELQLTDTPQAMLRTNALQATLAAMQADMASAPSERTVLWAEPNVSADDPRAQDGDSGSD